MPEFAIGDDVHERLTIDVTSGYKDADLQWLVASVAIHNGGFTGAFSTTFLALDVSRFLGEVRQLYATLNGHAQFTTWEKQIEIRLEGNGRGQIAVTGEAMDVAGTGNRLRFRIDTDQTYLPTLISQLETVCATYPPRAT
jgi:hypothetical protein